MKYNFSKTDLLCILKLYYESCIIIAAKPLGKPHGVLYAFLTYKRPERGNETTSYLTVAQGKKPGPNHQGKPVGPKGDKSGGLHTRLASGALVLDWGPTLRPHSTFILLLRDPHLQRQPLGGLGL